VVGRSALCAGRASVGWSAVAIMAAVLALDLPFLFHAPGPFDTRRWLALFLVIHPRGHSQRDQCDALLDGLPGDDRIRQYARDAAEGPSELLSRFGDWQ
jgi:hypothetical protein